MTGLMGLPCCPLFRCVWVDVRPSLCCSRRLLSKAMGARHEEVFDAALQALKRHQDDNLRASAFALHINFSQRSTTPRDSAFQRPSTTPPHIPPLTPPSTCGLLSALLFLEDSAFYEAGKVQLLSSLPELLALPALSPKLSYRLLVILGTLLYDDSNTTELAAALEVVEAVEAVRKAHSTDQQVQAVSGEVLQLLSHKS